jgi:hypothetical protein
MPFDTTTRGKQPGCYAPTPISNFVKHLAPTAHWIVTSTRRFRISCGILGEKRRERRRSQVKHRAWVDDVHQSGMLALSWRRKRHRRHEQRARAYRCMFERIPRMSRMAFSYCRVRIFPNWRKERTFLSIYFLRKYNPTMLQCCRPISPQENMFRLCGTYEHTTISDQKVVQYLYMHMNTRKILFIFARKHMKTFDR